MYKEFCKNGHKLSDTRRPGKSGCKICRYEYTKNYIKTRRWKYNKTQVGSRLKRVYGITLEQYNEMLLAQGNCCAICKSTNNGKHGETDKLFAVDHDHKTGKVRGLLCSSCNVTLGLIKEKVSTLVEMISYLGVPYL